MSGEASGLMAGASATPETPAEKPDISHTQAAEQPRQAASGHAWVEGLTGDLYKDGKPNFEALPEKYWKDGNPDIGSALKARAELEKKFSRGDHKAPEAYSLDVVKAAGVPEDDPLVGSFQAWAKTQGISQEAFNQLASSYLEVAGAQAQSMQVNIAAEKAKLGPDADAVINEQIDWARGLIQKGIWGADDFEEFKMMAGTAAGLKALNKLRQYYGETQRIPTTTQDPEGQPSREELEAMVGDPRYKTDPSFRMKVERLFERNFG